MGRMLEGMMMGMDGWNEVGDGRGTACFVPFEIDVDDPGQKWENF